MSAHIGSHAPTADESHHDALLRFENFARYTAQSEATESGRRAELPERERLSRVLNPGAALAGAL